MDYCYLDGYAGPVGSNSPMEPGHFSSKPISPIHSIILTSNRGFFYFDGYVCEPVGRRSFKGYGNTLLFGQQLLDSPTSTAT